MVTPTRTCASCHTPVPPGVSYCATCGEATPTEISQDAGTVHRPASELQDEAEQRDRVQRALGAGFELGRLLGRGGFAEVYAATDLKLQRTVAVKVLRPDLVVNRSLTERFIREARAAAKLRHPNIIPMYQVGEAEGLAYFLMPLIEGENLREYMERAGQLPIEEARRILREVAEALAVAHDAGLVHRDIKPDNIMLEGKERRAIVTDFGIAKALGSAEIGLTGTGMIIGTPQYMSPEQATGEREIDARSDIYSLGVVGYQMLTGRLPFEGGTTQEVLLKQVTATPKPIREVRAQVPAELAEAIERCLAKDPAKRWSSGAELARTTQPLGAAEMSHARAFWRHARSLSRRARIRVGLYVVAFAVTAGAMGFFRSGVVGTAWHHWTSLLTRPTAAAPLGGALFRSLSLADGGPAMASLSDTMLAVRLPTGELTLFDGSRWRQLVYCR